MNTQKITHIINPDAITISVLRDAAETIMSVMDMDIDAMQAGSRGILPALNENLRALTAINEVLLYFGDEGVFSEGV
jgi:hypothetical protein